MNEKKKRIQQLQSQRRKAVGNKTVESNTQKQKKPREKVKRFGQIWANGQPG